MTAIMRPEICLGKRPSLTVCSTCGSQDGSILVLSFRWIDDWSETEYPRKRMAGGTGVALCVSCRGLTRDALNSEIP